MMIDLHLPTEVTFGRGRLSELGSLTHRYGSCAIVICGRHSMRRTQVLRGAVQSLEGAGLRVTVVDTVSPNPRSDEVDDAVEVARRQGGDVIVGLGGGSAIDAAKAVALGMRHGAVGPLVGRTLVARADRVPVVAVPTTAGSGAEVTRGAIITDVIRGLRSGIRGPDVAPVHAVIDPAVLPSVPTTVAMDSGFDAFAHAVEGYLSRRSSPVTRALAELALEILLRRLPELVRPGAGGDPRDRPDLYDEMALAALLGGVNVALASSCLPHRLQQAMGAVPEVRISHGRGLAIVYPAWVRQTASSAPAACAALAARLGADSLESVVESLLAGTRLRSSLSREGFSRSDLRKVTAGVTGNIDNDPTPNVDADLLHRLLVESF